MTGLQSPQQRYALGVEYDGSAYNGWQIQPHAPSVQESLNHAISAVADAAIECVGAGRTDTGVHASGQVIHFDTFAERPLRSWLLGINSNLPPDIAVLWICPVAADFHARFSAVSRAYRYVIINRPVRSPLERQRAWWVHQPLDQDRMQQAADYLVGEHDFSAFRAAACQAHSAVRRLSRLSVSRSGNSISIECRANAFLHHMVRNIVGSLVRVGNGEEHPVWLRDLLATRDRRVSGMTAPAQGLTLTDIEYPQGTFDGKLYNGRG